MLPEVVNWKTGGVVKSISTLGVVKGDVNGKINGPTGKQRLKTSAELLVYLPEEREITEYQLIKLHTHSDSREFRTVTGGVFHVSGGSNRELVNFDPKSRRDATRLLSQA